MEVPAQTYIFWKHLQATDPTAYEIRMHLHDSPQTVASIAQSKVIALPNDNICISAPWWVRAAALVRKWRGM